MSGDVKAKFLVIYGYYENSKMENLQFISALGAFNDYEKAYGAAYLYLNDVIRNDYRPKERRFISCLGELECDTGYEMHTVNIDNPDATVDFVDILYIDDGKDESDGEK